ncbi:MAG: hypothetical protein E4G90_07225 [Gemmatimonadales bacterium]|nr:MAG: hypothetical protein E4G90_07225 [Gemmatimonadales bacterium]
MKTILQRREREIPLVLLPVKVTVLQSANHLVLGLLMKTILQRRERILVVMIGITDHHRYNHLRYNHLRCSRLRCSRHLRWLIRYRV